MRYKYTFYTIFQICQGYEYVIEDIFYFLERDFK